MSGIDPHTSAVDLFMSKSSASLMSKSECRSSVSQMLSVNGASGPDESRCGGTWFQASHPEA